MASTRRLGAERANPNRGLFRAVKNTLGSLKDDLFRRRRLGMTWDRPEWPQA